MTFRGVKRSIGDGAKIIRFIAIIRSSGYVIPMPVMADMLSANNMNNINVYDV